MMHTHYSHAPAAEASGIKVYKQPLRDALALFPPEAYKAEYERRKAQREAEQDRIWNDDNAFDGEVDE